MHQTHKNISATADPSSDPKGVNENEEEGFMGAVFKAPPKERHFWR